MTPADLFRALPISGKGLALLGSVSVHAAVALAAVGGAPHAARDSNVPADAVVEITALELATAEAPVQPIPMPAATLAATPARHHHHYLVPPDHDATSHDPSLRHVAALPSTQNLPVAAAAPAVLDAPAQKAPRFVMTVGPATGASGRIGAQSEGAEAARASAASEPAAEAAVDTSAKLRAGSSPSYTREAAAAGVEADVPLEIVIDSAGSVISARALTHVGYGLEEAALRSVRSYHFSPALRGGKPLAVRMRWLMRFQLR